VEQELPASLGEGQIAEFVEDDEVHPRRQINAAAFARQPEIGEGEKLGRIVEGVLSEGEAVRLLGRIDFRVRSGDPRQIVSAPPGPRASEGRLPCGKLPSPGSVPAFRRERLAQRLDSPVALR
jgi:hypothetical protein